MIIDPWGHKIADTGESEGIALARLSKTRVTEVRAKLPALSNRRPETY
jgi:predicted amidohydrolase